MNELRLKLLLLIILLFQATSTTFGQLNDMWWDEVQTRSRKALQSGDYQQALAIVEQATLYAKSQPHSAVYYYKGLKYMAQMYESMGNYAMALQYAEWTLFLGQQMPAKTKASPLMDRLYIAQLYMRSGSWKIAEQQLDTLVQELGPQAAYQPLLKAEATTLLAEAYLQQQQLEKAVNAFETASNIYLKHYGKNHVYYADAVNRTIYAYMQSGQYQKAFISSKNILPLWAEIAGQRSPIYAFMLNNIAVAAHRMGKYSTASYHYEASLELYQRIYGAEHPNCVSIRNNLGILYEQNGAIEKASKLLQQSIQELLTQVEHYYNNVSEIDRLHFYRTQIANNVDAFYSFVSRQSDTSLLLQMQEVSLKTKNAASHSSGSLRNIILSQNDLDLLALYQKWYQLRLKISQIYGWSKEEIQRQNLNIAQLNIEARELERQMATRSSAISAQFRSSSLTARQIHHKLEAGEVAIDFVHFHYRKIEGWTDSVMYYALITKADEAIPRLVPLCRARLLRQVLRREVGLDPFSGQWQSSYISNMSLNQRLYEAVWQPLSTHLEGIKRLHISPSGWLCQLAFGALRIPGEAQYLADVFEIHYYATLRDFVEAAAPRSDSLGNYALILGGVDFDMALESSAASEGVAALESDVTTSQLIHHQNTAIPWKALPESKTEVHAVAQQLDAAGFDCHLLEATQAREDSLKYYLSRQPVRILHLATHGYFIAGLRRRAAQQELTGLYNKLQQEPHPLWRSGLVLAGANHAWLGKAQVPGLLDGIVPAYDIAALNLFDTELVVLSACQTARGDIDDIEGVRGLQSAFRQAGVRYQILTLWNISDAAAAAMMQLFYKHYLSGKSIPKAFQVAQQEFRSMEAYQDPFYWAAFILIE